MLQIKSARPHLVDNLLLVGHSLFSFILLFSALCDILLSVLLQKHPSNGFINRSHNVQKANNRNDLSTCPLEQIPEILLN